MALFNIKSIKKVENASLPDDVKSLIRRRRLQVIVHSCIYYRLNNNLIPDYQYDSWGKELARLHKKYGVVKIGCYDSYFSDWVEKPGNTYTGFKLPINDNKIIALATDLVKQANEHKKI